MGYLLGAVTQDKLDKQRGVVQNEKRQGDNQPYGAGRIHDRRRAAAGRPPLSPRDDRLDGRPRRRQPRPTCASWFTDHYAPNNVVLALAGDIDAATARPMVEKWFGAIPRGPEVHHGRRRPGDARRPGRDARWSTRFRSPASTRAWTGPALTDPDAVPLAVGLHVLGGLVELAARQRAGARRAARGARFRGRAAASSSSSFLQARHGREAGRRAAPRPKRASTKLIAELVARRAYRRRSSSARRPRLVSGADRRARAGRRVLRQGRDAWPRACSMRAIRPTTRRSSSRWPR